MPVRVTRLVPSSTASSPNQSHRPYKLTLLTPLHIGRGREIGPHRYFEEDGWVKVVHDEGLFNLLMGSETEDETAIQDFIAEENVDLATFASNYGLGTQLQEIVAYSLQQAPAQLRQFAQFFRNADFCPYVPGSSIKGAIRTAVFYSLMKNLRDGESDRELFDNACKQIQRRIEEKERNTRLDDPIVQDHLQTFGLSYRDISVGFNPKNIALTDYMKVLTVGDTDPMGKDALQSSLVKGISYGTPRWDYVKRRRRDGTKGDHLESFVETVGSSMAPEVLPFQIKMDTFQRSMFRSESGKLPFEDMDKLLERCRDFAQDVLAEEKSFLRALQSVSPGWRTNVIADLLQTYEWLEDQRPNLRLGWGTGLDSKTILRLIDDSSLREEIRNDPAMISKPEQKYSGYRGLSHTLFPKTRKFVCDADALVPLGWCLIDEDREHHNEYRSNTA